MTILETHKLCKRFGGSQVTADVDLALQHHLEGHSLAGEIRRHLDFLRLAGDAAQRAGNLSRGQKQWLEIGMAVLAVEHDMAFVRQVATRVMVVQVDLFKGWTLAWPRLETAEFSMTIGSGRPMEDAARVAYRELVRWMAADFGFDELDA